MLHRKCRTTCPNLEVQSISDIFSEIARLAKRMTDTLLHCTTEGVSLPVQMKETRS